MQTADITARGSEFGIDEHFNGFELVHLPTGKTSWIGDGVDMFMTDTMRSISTGTKAWERAAKQFLKDRFTLYEAYFPELMDEWY